MLAVAARTPTRLEEAVCGERSQSATVLEIAKVPEVGGIGIMDIGEIQASQRVAVVAIDRPVQLLRRKPAKDTRAGKDFPVIVEMPLRCRSSREGAVRYGLGGS